MPNALLIIIQCALVLGPPWLALRAARDAAAKGAQADGLIRWATGMLALGAASLAFGYYSLSEIHTDEVWQQRNVDAPGIVLALEALTYPLMAMFITVPFAAFIWKQSKNRAVKRDAT
jgi:hypothetical protein